MAIHWNKTSKYKNTKYTYLGIKFDKEANKVRGEEAVISMPDSKVKLLVIPTNEELAIARETVALISGHSA